MDPEELDVEKSCDDGGSFSWNADTDALALNLHLKLVYCLLNSTKVSVTACPHCASTGARACLGKVQCSRVRSGREGLREKGQRQIPGARLLRKLDDQ